MKLVSPAVSKAAVREVVRECEEYQSIDPTPVSWKAGRLDVCENWRRVGMDMTHLGGRHYLTLINCGPSQFAIWRQEFAKGNPRIDFMLSFTSALDNINYRVSRQFLSLPIVQTLLPVTFGYSLSSRKTLEAVVMR